MRAYVINLARSVDRRAHIAAELRKTALDYEIMTAVDGRDLDLSDASLVDPALLALTQFMAGSAGAALSHLNAYKKIVADGLDNALVLEDDVILPPDLDGLAEDVAAQMSGAEIALLSINSLETCRMSRAGAVQLPSGRQLALPISVFQPRSGGAYVITREACERVIKCNTPVRANADDWWHFYREGALDRVRCVVPLAVYKSPELISTMGSYSLGSGLKGRIGWQLVSRKIPILHQALCYRRERIYRQWSRSELVDIPFLEKPSRLD